MFHYQWPSGSTLEILVRTQTVPGSDGPSIKYHHTLMCQSLCFGDTKISRLLFHESLHLLQWTHTCVHEEVEQDKATRPLRPVPPFYTIMVDLSTPHLLLSTIDSSPIISLLCKYLHWPHQYNPSEFQRLTMPQRTKSLHAPMLSDHLLVKGLCSLVEDSLTGENITISTLYCPLRTLKCSTINFHSSKPQRIQVNSR